MPPAAAIGGALLGGVAGAFGSNSKQSQTSWIDAGNATGAENAGQSGMMGAYGQLQDFVNRGPGGQDVTNAYGAQTDLAAMLKQMQESGGLPAGTDIAQAQNLAGGMFQAQRVGLQQNFLDQSQQADRQAALMGRGGNDPVLRAKLAQEQTRQSAMLDAQQGAFGQNLAMQLPGQRLGFAGQRANVLGGLATQAMQNRQSIAAMGEGIMNQERNFRLQTAKRYGEQTQSSGGGIGGAISGALGGAGTGMSLMNSFKGPSQQPGPQGQQWLPQAQTGQAFQQYSQPAGPQFPQPGQQGFYGPMPFGK
jgi:hypothetical protein